MSINSAHNHALLTHCSNSTLDGLPSEIKEIILKLCKPTDSGLFCLITCEKMWRHLWDRLFVEWQGVIKTSHL